MTYGESNGHLKGHGHDPNTLLIKTAGDAI